MQDIFKMSAEDFSKAFEKLDVSQEPAAIKASVRTEPDCFGSQCNECSVYPCDAIVGAK